MDLSKMLLQLRAELDNINAAIATLERLREGGRRGRPPQWLIEGKKPVRPKARKGGGNASPPAERGD